MSFLVQESFDSHVDWDNTNQLTENITNSSIESAVAAVQQTGNAAGAFQSGSKLKRDAFFFTEEENPGMRKGVKRRVAAEAESQEVTESKETFQKSVPRYSRLAKWLPIAAQIIVQGKKILSTFTSPERVRINGYIRSREKLSPSLLQEFKHRINTDTLIDDNFARSFYLKNNVFYKDNKKSVPKHILLKNIFLEQYIQKFQKQQSSS